jgi:Flp pilus assembly protein TadG
MLFRRTPRRRGQSLVEFALIAPMLLALMFILVELGIVFSVYIGLTNSAREAARFGSTYQYSSAAAQVPGCAAHPATGDPDISLVDCERAAFMDQVVMDTKNVVINVSSAVQLDPAGGGATDRYTYDPATFQTSYRYGSKLIVRLEYRHSLFFNLLGPAAITLKSQSTMRLEPGGL